MWMTCDVDDVRCGGCVMWMWCGMRIVSDAHDMLGVIIRFPSEGGGGGVPGPMYVCCSKIWPPVRHPTPHFLGKNLGKCILGPSSRRSAPRRALRARPRLGKKC